MNSEQHEESSSIDSDVQIEAESSTVIVEDADDVNVTTSTSSSTATSAITENIVVQSGCAVKQLNGGCDVASEYEDASDEVEVCGGDEADFDEPNDDIEGTKFIATCAADETDDSSEVDNSAAFLIEDAFMAEECDVDICSGADKDPKDGSTQELHEINAPDNQPPSFKTPEKPNQLVRADEKRQLHTSPAKKPSPLVIIEGRRQLLPGSIEYDASRTVKVTKQSSLFSGAVASTESSALSSRKGVKVDLLANFIEYKDQIHPTPIRPVSAKGRQSWPMMDPMRRPSTSPAHSTRQLGKRRSLPDVMPSSTHKSYDPVDYDIPSTLKRRMFSPKTPESQRGSRREVGLSKHPSIRELNKEKPASGIKNLERYAINVLSTAVKVFCTSCIMARCLTFIGADRSLVYYLIETPSIWFVRLYILLLHTILILVECRLSIPGILPSSTLNNLVHRSFVQSFVGLLDISMNTNRALVDYNGSKSEVEAWVDLAFIILRVSPRGVVVCSFLYFMLAVCGKDGRSIVANRSSNQATTEFTE